jgi:predicted secreted acid phosphatase
VKDAIIMDIDDTLVDSKAILSAIPKDYMDRVGWNIFHKILSNHPRVFHKWAVNIIRSYMLRGYTILFVTGREATQELIDLTLDTVLYVSQGIPSIKGNYEILMRPIDDYRSSSDVKRSLYESVIKGRYNVELAIDDDLKNAGLWKSLGISSLLVM